MGAGAIGAIVTIVILLELGWDPEAWNWDVPQYGRVPLGETLT